MRREAHCGCGNVTVVTSADPQLSFACHCDFCQRSSGSIAVFGAAFLDEDIESVEGDTTEVNDFPKWPGMKKWFCSKCGTTVHWVNPKGLPGMHMISIGCFADPDFPAPTFSVHTRYRHKWCASFKGAEDYETVPS